MTHAQRDRRPGLILFLSLLAIVGGPIFPSRSEEKPAPEPLPLPTEIADMPRQLDALGDPLPTGTVARLGSTRWWHGGRLRAVAYSQDGKRIAAASFRSIRIWDADRVKLLQEIPLPDVRELALSEDGKSLAAITPYTMRDGLAILVWKEGTEKPRELATKIEHPGCLHFQDGRLWIGAKSGIVCWDLDRDKPIIEYKHATSTLVTALAFFGGAKPMVAAATDFGVLVIKASGEKVADAPISTKDYATTVAFAPDGKSVAVGTDYGAVYAWSIKDGVLVKRFNISPHRDGVTSITYSPDGNQLLSVCHAGECYRSDALTGEKVSRVIAKEAPRDAAAAARTPALVLSPDGRRLAGLLGLKNEQVDPYLHVWDTKNGDELSRPFGHTSAVQKMAFQSDGSFLSFSETSEIILWNQKLAPTIRRELSKTRTGKSAALSTDGRVVLFPEESGVEIYDLKDLARPEKISTKKEKLYCAAFSPDPDVLVWSQYGSLDFWSVKNKSVSEIDLGRGRADTLAFSADGKRLILTDQGGKVQVRNVVSRKTICDLKNVKSDGPIALSPRGQVAAVWSVNEQLQFFDATSGEELPKIKGNFTVANDLAFTPDGRCLVVATEEGVRLFEPLTGRELFRLDGGQGAVQCLAFNQNGTLLATGGADSTVLFWDLRRILHMGGFSREERLPMLPEQWELLWTDLASPDSTTSFAGLRAFLDGGKGSVAFLRDRLLTHKTPVGEAEQRRLLNQLADPDYKERAKAFVALKKIGRAAEPMLREAFRTEKDEIMHLRLRAFLSELETDGIITPKDERGREMRVVQILRLMDTKPARQLLIDLAQEGLSEYLRDEARETLQRLKGSEPRD